MDLTTRHPRPPPTPSSFPWKTSAFMTLRKVLLKNKPYLWTLLLRLLLQFYLFSKNKDTLLISWGSVLASLQPWVTIFLENVWLKWWLELEKTPKSWGTEQGSLCVGVPAPPPPPQLCQSSETEDGGNVKGPVSASLPPHYVLVASVPVRGGPPKLELSAGGGPL